jgi:hypothetical protein
MAGFIGRGLADALRLALPLTLGLMLMQLPALAHAYSVALLQIAEATRSDIEQRKAAVRRYYRDAGESDEAVIGTLRRVEPSNADGLAASVAKARAFAAAHARIEAAPPLLRPVRAVLDLSDDPLGEKRAVLRIAADTHAPQIALNAGGIGYLVLGIVLGAFLARMLVGAAAALAGERSRRNRPA